MYKVKGTIWIENDNGPFIGAGRVILLENVKKFGSITVAAKSMKMSYRQAWELINSMNKQSQLPLVVATSGGSGGGGTKVTEEGEKLIIMFKEIQNRFYKFNEKESEKIKL